MDLCACECKRMSVYDDCFLYDRCYIFQSILDNVCVSAFATYTGFRNCSCKLFFPVAKLRLVFHFASFKCDAKFGFNRYTHLSNEIIMTPLKPHTFLFTFISISFVSCVWEIFAFFRLLLMWNFWDIVKSMQFRSMNLWFNNNSTNNYKLHWIPSFFFCCGIFPSSWLPPNQAVSNT